MFKELYEIIFIILLMQALQFQLLPPAFVECQSCVLVAKIGGSIHQKHLSSPSSELPKHFI